MSQCTNQTFNTTIQGTSSLLTNCCCTKQTLTFVYHATQNHAKIKRETAASLLVVSAASFLSMSSLLLQLHLTRENEPEVPVFVITRKLWDWAVAIFLRMRVADGRIVGEL